jgi:hypothetical protein
MAEHVEARKPGNVVHAFETRDDALRAIQGLKETGFNTHHIRIETSDPTAADYIADEAGVEALASETERPTDIPGHGDILVWVEAGNYAHLATRVMVDGLVDGAGIIESHEDGYRDSSTGSGAGVATSTGTATGITPGAGYEGNTGSSVETTSGVLGQFAPGADTSNPDDDFPGHERHHRHH